MTKQHFSGECVVCGEPIAMGYDPATDGVIDMGIDEERRVYTWIRHVEGADPKCAVYSSVVWEHVDGIR